MNGERTAAFVRVAVHSKGVRAAHPEACACTHCRNHPGYEPAPDDLARPEPSRIIQYRRENPGINLPTAIAALTWSRGDVDAADAFLRAWGWGPKA